MKLKDFVTIESGKNTNRLSEKELANQYTNLDAMMDFFTMAKEINNSSNIIAFDLYPKAGNYNARVISRKNSTKIITNQKMCKIIVDNQKISPYYLCYLLNEDNTVQRQKKLFTQGSFIERLRPSFLRNLDVKLLALPQQKLLGKIYVQSIYLNYLEKDLADKRLIQSKELLAQKIREGKTL
ncbi:hypothetical protein EAI26_07585 [Lactobacillus sp. 0.1XD8-4]|uniref:restriction endonuclease subunit S n=1 Tax=uncultured Limosilactobacillus sp. TaxID=2837629 RepID=UPI00129D73FA|nr:restriction endonuclease subunit S [uncultured Limosilactobacillus sp.]MRN07245.1 hypothetical protein [Lactobacillus sp. 0.1XD8-4]